MKGYGRFAVSGMLALWCVAFAADRAGSAELSRDSLATVKANVEADKAVLVDVREKREWDAGHVEGAVFLPLSAVKDGLSESELRKLPKGRVLYVHCVVGKRAVTAGNVFEKHGFDVRPIKPGYVELIAAGFEKAPAGKN